MDATVNFEDLGYLQTLSTHLVSVAGGFVDLGYLRIFIYVIYLTTVSNPPSLSIPPPRNWTLYYDFCFLTY